VAIRRCKSRTLTPLTSNSGFSREPWRATALSAALSKFGHAVFAPLLRSADVAVVGPYLSSVFDAVMSAFSGGSDIAL
jgi:hypothetical protein